MGRRGNVLDPSLGVWDGQETRRAAQAVDSDHGGEETGEFPRPFIATLFLVMSLLVSELLGFWESGYYFVSIAVSWLSAFYFNSFHCFSLTVLHLGRAHVITYRSRNVQCRGWTLRMGLLHSHTSQDFQIYLHGHTLTPLRPHLWTQQCLTFSHVAINHIGCPCRDLSSRVRSNLTSPVVSDECLLPSCLGLSLMFPTENK